VAFKIVVIGTSLGGLSALKIILGKLPAEFLVQVGGNKPTISLQPETPKLKLFDF
jgi:hypothetical protein